MPNPTEINALFYSDLAGTKEKLEAELGRSLSLIASRVNQDLDVNAAGACMLRYLKTPGKRLRPLLFLSTLRALDPERDIDSNRYRMACGLELFHEFILIHDDLIDRSDTRRGAPTLWRRLESEVGLPEPKARSTALIIGDIIFACAIDILTSGEIPIEITSKYLATFLQAARETGWGAIGEIMISEQPFLKTNTGTIEAIYQAKTTRYTFEAPMILAACICRTPDPVQEILTRMARPLGLAFQLENDLHELAGYLGGRSRYSADSELGLKTLPLGRLLEICNDRQRKDMAALLDEPDSDRRRARLAEAIDSAGLIPAIRLEIDRLFEQPATVLDQSGIDPDLRMRLTRIVAFLCSNRNHSEAGPVNDDLGSNS
jgi:geranylgeranyl diphosphate synthase type I